MASVCYSDICDAKHHLIDSFCSGTNDCESGDVLEGLFESVSTSGRFRTVSSSSVSLAVPSLGSCDIFPEIAGVVSASDSETDVSEYLVSGRDCFRAGNFLFSPPPRRKFRQSSTKQSSDGEDPSMKEMLDTLCYTVHDLTHINGVVDNVVLDWQNGAALEDSLTEVIVKTEPCCENTDGNSDDSLVNGFIVSMSEGIIASDVNSLLEKFEAETEITFDEEQNVVCSTDDIATSSLDDCNVDTAGHKTDPPATALQSELDEKNMHHSPTAYDMQSQKDHHIDVGDVNVGQTQFKAGTFDSTRCSTTENETDVQARVKKPDNRSTKTDAEICLSSKWITDVDRIEVSEEKRKEMMKKARAISRAISKKAAASKPNLSVSNAEHLHSVSDLAASEKASQDDVARTAEVADLKRHEGGKVGWRIPRVQNVPTVSDATGTVGNRPSLVSKVSPPFSKDASSSSGWHRRSHKTGRSREIGGKMSHRPFTSHQVPVLGDKTENVAVVLSASSDTLTGSSCQTLTPNVTEANTGDGLSVGCIAEVSTEVAAETERSDKLVRSCDSSQNLLRVPSREMIEKIQSSSKQKSAILLPNAVPARGERGTAVGIEIPSQKNINVNPNTCLTDKVQTTASTEHGSPLVVSTSAVSLPCVSPVQSTATKKRKLNILQYKSIFPQRQKTQLQSVAVTRPVELPTVYVYGRYRDVLHDHNYISEGKHNTWSNKESAVESSLVLTMIAGSEVNVVKDKVSQVTETAPSTVEAIQNETESDVVVAASVNNNTVKNLTRSVITSQLKPTASFSSSAFELRRESEFVSKVGKSKNSSVTTGVQSVTVDSMPAYFDVVSLPNRQTKISVSAATLVTKKMYNPQSVMIAGDSDSTQQLLEDHSDNTLHCEKDISRDVESRISVSPRRRRDSEAMTVKSRCSSRSSSVSSAVSVSSDEESSSSRSRSSSRSSSGSSYSSDSCSSTSRSRSRDSRYRSHHRRRSLRRCSPGSRIRDWRRQKQRKSERKRCRGSCDRNNAERRVIYVGKIPRDFTQYDLRRKMGCFGEISDCSVHRRNFGDNYGFVTFLHTDAAYSAIEKGRTVRGCEEFDFCFGGRRQFCKSDYADLDGDMEWEEEMECPTYSRPAEDGATDFDYLLQQAQRKLHHKRYYTVSQNNAPYF